MQCLYVLWVFVHIYIYIYNAHFFTQKVLTRLSELIYIFENSECTSYRRMFGVTIHCQSVLRIWQSSFNTIDKLRVFDELATCHVLFAIIKTTSENYLEKKQNGIHFSAQISYVMTYKPRFLNFHILNFVFNNYWKWWNIVTRGRRRIYIIKKI